MWASGRRRFIFIPWWACIFMWRFGWCGHWDWRLCWSMVVIVLCYLAFKQHMEIYFHVNVITLCVKRNKQGDAKLHLKVNKPIKMFSLSSSKLWKQPRNFGLSGTKVLLIANLLYLVRWNCNLKEDLKRTLYHVWFLSFSHHPSCLLSPSPPSTPWVLEGTL